MVKTEIFFEKTVINNTHNSLLVVRLIMIKNLIFLHFFRNILNFLKTFFENESAQKFDPPPPLKIS